MISCLDLITIKDADAPPFRVCGSSTILDKLRLAREAGFEGVELWDKDFESPAQVRAVAASLGLTICSYKQLDGWFVRPDRDAARRLLDRGHEAGAACCVVVPVHSKEENPTFAATFLDRYRLLQELSAGSGLKLAFENNSFATQCRGLREMTERLDHAESLVLDLYHLHAMGELALFPHFLARAAIVHVSDAGRDPLRDNNRLLPTDGIIDYSVLREAVPLPVPVSLGVYNAALRQIPPAELARTCYRKLQAALFGVPL